MNPFSARGAPDCCSHFGLSRNVRKVAAIAREAERLDSCVRRILILGVYKRACLVGVPTFVLSCMCVCVCGREKGGED